MNYFPLFRRSLSNCPNPTDPSHLPSSVRAVVLNYQLENVEHGKQSIKGEANQALSRPLDLTRFLCRGGRLRAPPARKAPVSTPALTSGNEIPGPWIHADFVQRDGDDGRTHCRQSPGTGNASWMARNLARSALVWRYLFAFLGHGSLGLYDNRSSAIHFQPQLLPHLIGGNWLLLVGLTVAIAFAKPLVFELKWPLLGLGATNALFMLGDVIVLATAILLSHHVSHFLHMTVATLTAFLIAVRSPPFPAIHESRTAPSASPGTHVSKWNVAGRTYQEFLQQNREIVELAQLQRLIDPTDRDLLIARSETIDDSGGWVVLMSPSPVLFCTDAEVMLTP
jgi:hypothetical protein